MRRRSPLRPVLLTAVLAVLAALVALLAPASTASGPAPAAPAAAPAAAVPGLRVTTFAGGLNHPWDIKRIGAGRFLVTERDPARLSLVTRGQRRTVDFPAERIWVSGETGLMGLEVDPAFARNGRFYTCSGWKLSGGRHDVRVVAWRLSGLRATPVKTLVGGFPTTSGRHGGCRLLIARDGSLLVGTGDAAVGTNPRNQASLGGKVLRLNRVTGRPWPTNPFVRAANPARRYLLTFGHRNVQGLAERSDGSLWSVEQGSYRDDEVNRLVRGGDYGWNPVPGYNEDVPMTDQRLPGRQVGARWSSGSSTIATSGADFVYGSAWGSLNGTLAVAALKAQRVVFLRFDARGVLRGAAAPPALRGLGRLRTTERVGSTMVVLTDGDGGTGRVLQVVPR